MKQLCDILGAETVDSIPYRLNEVLFYGDSDRDPIYRAICDMYANDLSYDWFYDFYQSLYAQRKDLKQDFTPKSISDVLLRISSSDSAKITYEPSAGTGSLLIRLGGDRVTIIRYLITVLLITFTFVLKNQVAAFLFYYSISAFVVFKVLYFMKIL